jgi:serine/threonine protein kinase
MEPSPRHVGRQLGHYEVLALLGEGGMGAVYAARDTKLGRKVALKLLPSDFTDDPNRLRRFEQEARAASALNHPNILTIYEISETDGTQFIATEFVDRETIRQRMARAPMKIDEVLRVTEQVVSALAAAHEAGIIHRDIKPENIMLRRDGLVKVLDFGLAKLINQQTSDPEATTLAVVKTTPGVVMGTLPYMSPEQVLGRDLDHRSDVFSLGVVMYEMATGQSPFTGTIPTETLSRILHAQPEAMTRLNSEVPMRLELVVRKCLEKERENRYQTQDLAVALGNLRRESEVSEKGNNDQIVGDARAAAGTRVFKSQGIFSSRWTLLGVIALMVVLTVLSYWFLFHRGTAVTEAEIKSLAVLPFKSQIQEAKEDYLGLGIANEIITKVSQTGALTVRPTSAVRKYVNQDVLRATNFWIQSAKIRMSSGLWLR